MNEIRFKTSVMFCGTKVNSPYFEKKSQRDTWRNILQTISKKVNAGFELSDKDLQFLKANEIKYEVGGLTVLQYAAHFFKSYKNSVEPPTFDKENARFRLWIYPIIGEIRLPSLTRDNCRDVLIRIKEKGHGRDLRVGVRNLMVRIFDQAIEDDRMTKNPATKLTIDKERFTPKQPKYIEDPKQVSKYIFNAYKINPTFGIFSEIGLNIGARKQELIALRNCDVDHKKREIRLERKFVQSTKEFKPGRKNGAGDTLVVDMPMSLSESIKKHQAASKFNRPEDLLCPTLVGTYLDPRNILRWHASCLKKCGMKDKAITIHGYRHTMATHRLTKGETLQDVQARLGHKNAKSTEVYAKVIRSKLKANAELVTFESEDSTETEGSKLTSVSKDQR